MVPLTEVTSPSNSLFPLSTYLAFCFPLSFYNKKYTQFTGVFNSNYYAIEGLTASLFIEARNCEIKNLRLINCDISSETSNVGAVAGFASNAIISDCTVTGAVRGASANAQVGGIVGSASLSQIRVCKNEAKYSPMDDNKME
jgi:hypothetical protein